MAAARQADMGIGLVGPACLTKSHRPVVKVVIPEGKALASSRLCRGSRSASPCIHHAGSRAAGPGGLGNGVSEAPVTP